MCSSSWPESWQSSAATIPNLLLDFNKPQCVVGSDNLCVKGVGVSEIGSKCESSKIFLELGVKPEVLILLFLI